MMSIIIFFIVLGVLVLVHELGHFVFAKKAGVQVDEFGFGFPPRLLTLGKKWGTVFTLNWIPLGGFVKIVGENYEAPSLEEKNFGEPKEKMFTEVNKRWQASILFAGVFFNFLFAWLLFAVGFSIGLPAPVDNNFGYSVQNPKLTIISVLKDSPSEIAGLKSGDKIIAVKDNKNIVDMLDVENVSEFISKSEGVVEVEIERGKDTLNFSLAPEQNLSINRKIVGINMDMVGTLSLPIHRSILEGGKVSAKLVYLTVDGLYNLIKDAFIGKADFSSVTGPVGIVGMVGDASKLGFGYLLTFTALISINLAVINLVPIPALDGGRLLFVGIEAITNRRIKPSIIGAVNSISFALLIVLMLIVTYRDILKLF
ncbi:MAG: RIP metalloprotease RseP [Patescibacteria group bacterium]